MELMLIDSTDNIAEDNFKKFVLRIHLWYFYIDFRFVSTQLKFSNISRVESVKLRGVTA